MALSDSLVAYWKLDEATGNSADTAGSSTLTSNNSPGTATGKIGLARTFNGINQYLSCASNTALLMGNIDFTISAWVNLNSLPATNNTAYQLVTKDSDSPANARDYTIDYFRDAFGSYKFRFYINGGGLGKEVQSTITISTGAWYHLVVWHNAAADTLNISVNGSVSSAGTSGTVPQTSSAQFRIGARQYSGFEGYLNGLVDEVAIWKRVLDSTERSSLYNSGSGNTITITPITSQPAVLFQMGLAV